MIHQTTIYEDLRHEWHTRCRCGFHCHGTERECRVYENQHMHQWHAR